MRAGAYRLQQNVEFRGPAMRSLFYPSVCPQQQFPALRVSISSDRHAVVFEAFVHCLTKAWTVCQRMSFIKNLPK